MNLSTSVSAFKTVGKTLRERLKYLGLETARDLLLYFPFRYEDYSQTLNIEEVQEGMQITVRAKIEMIASKRSFRKRKVITEAVISDETGKMRIVWFGQPFIMKQLQVGDEVLFSGKTNKDMFGIGMTSPTYEKVKKEESVHTARIVPMYSLTNGITQKQLRFLVKEALPALKEMEDWLPEKIRERAQVIPFADTIKGIHFPDSQEHLSIARHRMKFDELFVTQLRAEMIRQSLQRLSAPSLTFHEQEIKEFVASLPFTLTKGQKIAAWEMLQDMSRTEPMNRLLEGDVGSGKTVVGGLVMYNTILNGYQAAIMAPTEILAKQHYESLIHMLGEKTVIGLMTSGSVEVNHELEDIDESSKEKKSLSKRKKVFTRLLKEGRIPIVVGTHALLSEGIDFHKLGLAIVDEQHRFGVEQRKTLHDKSGDISLVPHFLSMTATPIPRSFALALYGDLDISMLKDMPAGRKPIKTRLVEPKFRDRAYQFIRDQIKEGRQVFVICPLIDNIESASNNTPTTDKKSVLSEYKKLSEEIFPDLRVAYLHGKMKSEEKDEVMGKFAAGETDLLISTSVIEVGVNIPNATVMMIEGADRFGLAQLHQFRGRVGRSIHQSFCLLFTDSDSKKTAERLKFFESTTDGFKVAEYDLEMRGPGEVYGKTQSGMTQFRFASLQDTELIKLARDIVKDTDIKKYPSLKQKVSEWERVVHLE